MFLSCASLLYEIYYLHTKSVDAHQNNSECNCLRDDVQLFMNVLHLVKKLHIKIILNVTISEKQTLVQMREI